MENNHLAVLIHCSSVLLRKEIVHVNYQQLDSYVILLLPLERTSAVIPFLTGSVTFFPYESGWWQNWRAVYPVKCFVPLFKIPFTYRKSWFLKKSSICQEFSSRCQSSASEQYFCLPLLFWTCQASRQALVLTWPWYTDIQTEIKNTMFSLLLIAYIPSQRYYSKEVLLLKKGVCSICPV